MNNLRNLLVIVILGCAFIWLFGCGDQQAADQLASKDEKTPAAVVTEKEKERLQSEVERPLTSVNVDDVQVKPVAADISLDDLLSFIRNRHGKPLVLNFWATWCTPCMEEMPHLVELHERYKEKVDFMAVSADSFTGTTDKVPDVMNKLNMSFPTKILKVENQNKAIETLDPEWGGDLPRTFIYNIEGERVMRLIGAKSKEEFEEAISEVLNNNVNE